MDRLIGFVYILPIYYLLGAWDYALKRQNPPYLITVALLALGFLCFLLVNGYFLMKNGQTIGKKLMKIRIADLQGNVPDFTKLSLARILPLYAVQLLPGFGPFLLVLDDLFIFRADRRCIHDLLAGTKVVKVTQPKVSLLPPDEIETTKARDRQSGLFRD